MGTGAENLIPIELAIKIARKIKAKEPFAAYIIIPMWPEGNPTTAAMQEILFWQVCTASSDRSFFMNLTLLGSAPIDLLVLNKS